MGDPRDVSVLEVDLDYRHGAIGGGGGINHGYLDGGVGHSREVAHGGELRN